MFFTIWDPCCTYLSHSPTGTSSVGCEWSTSALSIFFIVCGLCSTCYPPVSPSTPSLLQLLPLLVTAAKLQASKHGKTKLLSHLSCVWCTHIRQGKQTVPPYLHPHTHGSIAAGRQLGVVPLRHCTAILGLPLQLLGVTSTPPACHCSPYFKQSCSAFRRHSSSRLSDSNLNMHHGPAAATISWWIY